MLYYVTYLDCVLMISIWKKSLSLIVLSLSQSTQPCLLYHGRKYFIYWEAIGENKTIPLMLSELLRMPICFKSPLTPRISTTAFLRNATASRKSFVLISTLSYESCNYTTSPASTGYLADLTSPIPERSPTARSLTPSNSRSLMVTSPSRSVSPNTVITNVRSAEEEV